MVAKEESMKHIWKKASIVAGMVLWLALSATAQRSVKANIPFDFQIGDTTLKAGEYTIKAGASDLPEFLVFHDATGKAKAVVNGSRVETAESAGMRRLLFTRYGDRYFLSQVWMTEEDSGCEVRKNKEERELMMANLHKPHRVLVALGK
jgi:hypothetical protein